MTDKLEALRLEAETLSGLMVQLAENDIDSDSFAVMSYLGENGTEHECDLPITETALRASAVIDQLLAALEEKDQRIAELEGRQSKNGVSKLQSEVIRLRIDNEGLKQRLQQPALADVMAERQRQISAEGWTPNLDDQHTSSEMAGAAACYASHVNARGWVYSHNPSDYQSETESSNWPWDASWWKPTNPRRDLVKAGALILAEIERLDRAAAKVEGE